MENESLIYRGQQIIGELSGILRRLSDSEVVEMLANGAVDDLFDAILAPSEVKKYPDLHEFFLANRGRSSLLAVIRHAITQNYSFQGKNQEGQLAFISPSYIQWFDDGVMFLQGKERFEGLLGLYRKGGQLSYAVLAREAESGQQLGPEFFEFIGEDEFKKRLEKLPKRIGEELDKPIRRLEVLLADQDNDESKYQELFIEFPWVFGAQYQSMERHTKLDDGNIPDFTGTRVHNGTCDIIELKPPFTKMFRENGELGQNFNDAWNQAERYLDFARTERDYLRRKGLEFDNPKCYLVLGHNLLPEEIKNIRIKERMNPAVQLLTYDDLLVFMKATVDLIRKLANISS